MTDATVTPNPIVAKAGPPVDVAEEVFDHPVKAWTSDDLEMEVAQLGFVTTRLDELVMSAEEWPRRVLAGALKDLRAEYGYLKDVISSLDRLLGEKMNDYRETIDGVGTLERHRLKSMTKWRKDELLRDVLDTRLVDPATGEVADESPLDKVLAVWNLGAPRTTVLRDRGLQPDEYCDVTDNGGWTVVIK